MAERYWLMKTEPDVFSIDDLKRRGTAPWDGVRNYQARNFMRDGMKRGDRILFYHSSTTPSGVAGLARVEREAYPDATSWDPRSEYFDSRSTREKPLWMMVDVAYESTFPHFVSLEEMKAHPALQGMLVIRRGMRLSVQPVEKVHFDLVCRLGAAR